MSQVITGDEPLRAYSAGSDLNKIPPKSYTWDSTNTSGSNHNASQEDVGRVNDMNFAGANTFTVLSEAAMSKPFIPNQVLVVCCIGAGTTTIVEGTDVTITPIDGFTLVMAAAPAYVMLRYIGNDVWHLMGHLV